VLHQVELLLYLHQALWQEGIALCLLNYVLGSNYNFTWFDHAVCQGGCWNLKLLHQLELLFLQVHQALWQEGNVSTFFMSLCLSSLFIWLNLYPFIAVRGSWNLKKNRACCMSGSISISHCCQWEGESKKVEGCEVQEDIVCNNEKNRGLLKIAFDLFWPLLAL